MNRFKITVFYSLLLLATISFSYGQSTPASREHILLDSGWKFALGHSYNKDLDFGNGKGSFSYYAKTGYGDGAAAEKFDDRAWRAVDLPHDWAIELPFSRKGVHSHGFKAMGDQFPENNVGWYRKNFFIPEGDKDKRVFIEFEGIFRDAKIWINGFYIGEEHSGYSSYQYDISAYLNYGENNVVSVRVDAGMSEGWFYEGAGIYRHVWLNKTNPLHIDYNGTFITSEINQSSALVTARTTVVNDGTEPASFAISQNFTDGTGKQVAGTKSSQYILQPGETKEFWQRVIIEDPKLWSLESPNLYHATTKLITGDGETDDHLTTFGIRTVRFSADSGFFLNGKHVFLKGTNNHLDFSAAGVAVPDGLQEYRIQVLKSMGCNAIRCSHNPPNVAFLDDCDRMGILVLDENRLMGTSPEHYQQLSRMILRDRNHPSIFAWSIGNEEWAIEGNEKGARIAFEMETYAHRLDSTRRITAAVSGGRVEGISTTIDVMGYNYNEMGDIDEHHKKFPEQPMMLTEERTSSATRGTYVTDAANAHMVPTDWDPKSANNVAQGLQFCSTRPFMAGMFYWTGFEYHGEPDPYSWPQVISQFGIVDLCGFPKDQYYFVKSAWTDTPMVHIGTHWNWPGREGQNIYTKVYSNCDEVELFLNGKSMGRKAIPHLSGVVWEIPYKKGVLLAKGYKNGKLTAADKVETTGTASAITMQQMVYTGTITGSRSAIVNIQLRDNKNRVDPLAMNQLSFEVTGPAKIIGVANGDPSSHDPEVFTETIRTDPLSRPRMTFATYENQAVQAADTYSWRPFQQTRVVNKPESDTLVVAKTDFDLSNVDEHTSYTYFPKNISSHQSVYLNGKLIGKNEGTNDAMNQYELDHALLKAGKNVLLIIGKPFVRKSPWEEMNTDPGIIQERQAIQQWQRKTFNGMAQVILLIEDKPGNITVKAAGDGLKPGIIRVDNK
jgi:beta-galactosidase